MKTSTKAAIGLTSLLLAAVWLFPDDSPTTTSRRSAPRPAPTDAVVERAATPGPPSPAAPGRTGDTSALLVAAGGGDGDSWRDTSGREYRLGLVNAPESGECFGAQATAERKKMVAKGFRATAYSRERYGRNVSVVTTADGTSLNVDLARRGFVNDRYLQHFRHENLSLAAQLDIAFTSAKTERAGLWAVCSASGANAALIAPVAAAPAAAPARGACHPDYVTCMPVQGSGRGQADDLDCGDVGRPVQVRQFDVDPYRFDTDDNGSGCA